MFNRNRSYDILIVFSNFRFIRFYIFSILAKEENFQINFSKQNYYLKSFGTKLDKIK